MGLFKSKEEKKIERSIQIQKTLGMFAGQIKKLKQQEAGYIQTARDARRMGAGPQEQLARQALKATVGQRRRLEHQILTLRIAMQMKDQAETHAEFAKSLRVVSQSIGELFNEADLTRTQKDFEMAMNKAQNMEQRIDLFLSAGSQTLFGETYDAEDQVSDDEIEALISDQALATEAGADDDIRQKLAEIEKRLGESAG